MTPAPKPAVSVGAVANGHAAYDAIVIGAGIIGASVTLELVWSGRKVLCIDKGPGPGAGSTSASSSIIRFSYSTPDAVLTAWESAPAWEDWAGHLGVIDPDGMAQFIRTGMLLIETPGDVMARVTALWDDLGIGYERFDGAALRQRFPSIDPGRYFPPRTIDDPEFGADATEEITAVLEPLAGYVDDPMLAARNVAFAARRAGATFRFRAEVTGIERSSGRVAGVRLDGGEVIEAPVVVNVGGPHSMLLNRMAGVDGDMRIRHRALRQEVFAVPAPDGLRLEQGGPILSDPDIGQYFRPQAGGTLLVGGIEPPCDVLEWIDDPDRFDEHPTVERFETSMLRLARRVPAFGIPHRPTGLAALDVSDDWVPIYDGSSLPGWFMACGTSGNQFKNAPMAGRFMVALIDAAARGHDHDADPVRVVGLRTGRAIDLGVFSRRRSPASTSGTVMG